MRQAADEADERIVTRLKVEPLLQFALVRTFSVERRCVVARGEMRIRRRIPHRGVYAIQDTGERAAAAKQPVSPQPNSSVWISRA